MLERQRDFTPVTASIVDRHVLARGSQEKVPLACAPLLSCVFKTIFRPAS